VSGEFDLLDVARLILESIADLHARGYQLLRVYPGMAASGMYWRTSIGTAGSRDGFRFTTGDEFDVAGMQVSATTTASELADAILSALPDPGIGSDWAYAGWFVELLGLCRRQGTVPIAYADYYDLDPAWEIGWGGQRDNASTASDSVIRPRGRTSPHNLESWRWKGSRAPVSWSARCVEAASTRAGARAVI
jgi:hypothetical protein